MKKNTRILYKRVKVLGFIPWFKRATKEDAYRFVDDELVREVFYGTSMLDIKRRKVTMSKGEFKFKKDG